MARIAVIGGGISGMAAAHFLSPCHEVWLYEREGQVGGHTHTVAVPSPRGTIGVDTGFIVFNERNYPRLVKLFAKLGVASQPSDMSFSVSSRRTGFEYSSRGASGFFADWIQKYIFPGAELASLAAVLQSLARVTKLSLYHAEEIGAHYARTLRAWRERFLAVRPQVRALGFDDRFVRMWEYYLASCEAAFLERQIGDLQVLLTKHHNPRPLMEEPDWDGRAAREAAAPGPARTLSFPGEPSAAGSARPTPAPAPATA